MQVQIEGGRVRKLKKFVFLENSGFELDLYCYTGISTNLFSQAVLLDHH